MSNKKLTLKPKDLRKLLAKVRIKILKILYKQDSCACEIIQETKLKNNLVSHHLKILSDMGYIKGKRNGTHIMYSLKDEKRAIIQKLLNLIEI
jgi:DNA-binding transcriptional ArsR family regulator